MSCANVKYRENGFLYLLPDSFKGFLKNKGLGMTPVDQGADMNQISGKPGKAED